jgi:cysteine-rich repeat protein
VKDSAEDCDDGNATAGDGCGAQCSHEFACGNSVCEVLKGETCEQCAEDCCTCGDGLCEALNGESCSNCPDDCCTCGDGACDLLQGETCGGCKSDCCPGCGDGNLDSGETCDDGNNVGGDGCAADCQDEDGQVQCGNGVLEQGEECDDGNTTAGDGCSQMCWTEFTCGDLFCDTASDETCALCPGDCCPNCGNGLIDVGEECDGASTGGVTCTTACYDGGTISCTPSCQLSYAGCTGDLPTCGDGDAECNEPCDGADLKGATCLALGYGDGALSCAATCSFDTSGCGPLLGYLNQDFDVQCPPAGWTLGGDWECGAPTWGPLQAYSVPNCIATNLQGNYSPGQSSGTATVTTPPIDLTTATEPYLSMRAWWHTEGGYDGFNVKVSTDGGATYSLLSDVSPPYGVLSGAEYGWDGNQSALGWQEVTGSLLAYVGQTIRLRIGFHSDSSYEFAGVYIDDMKVLDMAMMPLSIPTADQTFTFDAAQSVVAPPQVH